MPQEEPEEMEAVTTATKLWRHITSKLLIQEATKEGIHRENLVEKTRMNMTIQKVIDRVTSSKTRSEGPNNNLLRRVIEITIWPSLGLNTRVLPPLKLKKKQRERLLCLTNERFYLES